MIARIVEVSLQQRVFICVLGLLLLVGGLYAFHVLDIVAYPDPAPPFIEVISQKPGWSAEEIERLITIPLETGLQGIPGLTEVRSLSLFGLSEVKVYFDFGTDYFRDRQELLNRLQMVSLPEGVQPFLSPWWPIAEIYRYELSGDPGISLTELKTIQDWLVRREFRRVPGVIDVTAFGGTTREYHVDLDPGSLISYGVSLPDVVTALRESNANVGGSYITMGSQNYNVRGVGLIEGLQDIENIVVAEKDGTPVFVRNLGKVSIGHAIRLGKVGINERDDVVEGVVLLQRASKALPTLQNVQKKVQELGGWKLPQGVHLTTFYDRTALIHTVVETVLDILVSGMVLVFVILFVFLGHFRTSLIVAMTIPMALLFTFSMMVLLGQSANLISLGSIDFGIIIDATLIMVESIFFHLGHDKKPGLTNPQVIVRAARHVGREIFFSTLIIVVAFIPLFTMTGVPGKIFAPMSVTYGFALIGALLMAWTLAPVLCSYLLTGPIRHTDTWVMAAIRRVYAGVLRWCILRPIIVIVFTLLILLGTLGALKSVGGEFMPALEEGNLWVRVRLPIDISFEEAAQLATEMRAMFKKSPEVTTVASQLGRPDDGTDPESFFNVEFFVNLKAQNEWRNGLTKDTLIEELELRLGTIPGISYNFSQLIQDAVEEAMSGVKSENSVKLFGNDLKTLEVRARDIEHVMKTVPGVKDLSVMRALGQPNLVIQVDRDACARYGVRVADVNAMVEAAVGGKAVTEVIEGDRRFDLAVRFLPEYRRDAESIGAIQVRTLKGARIPLKQLAEIKRQVGAFMIYRQNNERYIPVMFTVRGRDLAGTVEDAQRRIAEQVQLPERYHLEWAGHYDQLIDEQERLAKIIPVTLLIILFLLYTTFNNFTDAFLVLAGVPFALVGAVLALAVTGTPFSISAAVGLISTLGVTILGGVLLVSSIRELRTTGLSMREAILGGAELQLRPILMATLAAAIGLLPAAVATGIGSQAQKPLARVVVGGMLTAAFLILVVLPVLYEIVHRRDAERPQEQ
jgi:cobalt-zinc-cadmium resistance protein CzcA